MGSTPVISKNWKSSKKLSSKNQTPFNVKKTSKIFLPTNKSGIIYIQSTRNNTLLTLVDSENQVKAWASGGSVGLRHSRKSTVHAAEMAAAQLASKAQLLGITSVTIHMRGLGMGKQKALRAFQNTKLQILEIFEKTPLAHNGCRAPSKRRL